MPLRRPLVIVLLAALAITGAARAAEDEVLADGTPPLTSRTVNDFAAYFEWILDVELTEGQRNELRRLMVDAWERQDAPAMRGIQSLARQYGKVAAADKATRDFWREENQARYVEAIRNGTDRASKWALAVYEAAHQPLLDGEPPLTRQMADAQLEVLSFMAAVVRGAEPVELPADVKDAWARHLKQGWASLDGERKKFVANMPLLWAAIRAGWPQMPEADREKWRRQWRKDLGPLLDRVPEQPEPRAGAAGAGRGGTPQDALARAMEATEQKTRELDAKLDSGDPDVAWRAAMEKLQHQQATYQMINNISRMQFETSQAIISNMNAGWQYEYRYR